MAYGKSAVCNTQSIRLYLRGGLCVYKDTLMELHSGPQIKKSPDQKTREINFTKKFF